MTCSEVRTLNREEFLDVLNNGTDDHNIQEKYRDLIYFDMEGEVLEHWDEAHQYYRALEEVLTTGGRPLHSYGEKYMAVARELADYYEVENVQDIVHILEEKNPHKICLELV